MEPIPAGKQTLGTVACGHTYKLARAYLPFVDKLGAFREAISFDQSNRACCYLSGDNNNKIVIFFIEKCPHLNDLIMDNV